MPEKKTRVPSKNKKEDAPKDTAPSKDESKDFVLPKDDIMEDVEDSIKNTQEELAANRQSSAE